MNTEHILPALRELAFPIADLNPDPANARKHADRDLTALRASLNKFGQRKPIVVQKQGMIVRSGNGMLEAAKSLGWDCLACVVVEEDDVTATAWAIADNRTAELSEWDKPVLADLLGAFDVDQRAQLGFDAGAYDQLLADLQPKFVPNTNPEQGGAGVTQDDLTKAGQEIGAGIAGDPATQLEVVCPQCAHLFKIDTPPK